MQFNWTTFIFEIINFLVLVWVLKRFFYKPVKTAIKTRHMDIERQISEAKRDLESAESMKQQYENRLNEWEEEKKQLRIKLQQELNVERAHQVELLRKHLDEEKEKAVIIQQRQIKEYAKQTEEQALVQAGQFAANLLVKLSGEELEQAILQLLLQEITEMAVSQRETLVGSYNKEKPSVVVTSRFELNTQSQALIENTLSKLVDAEVRCEFKQDSDLIAGLRINIGQFVFRANLQDELRFFTESAYAAR